MFPYKTSLHINRRSKEPLFLQLTNQFIHLIKEGTIPSGTKLIGTRSLAELLQVHRKTIVACYEELVMQGWLEAIPKKGTFVPKDLPFLKSEDYRGNEISNHTDQIGFSYYKSNLHHRTIEKKDDWMYINDGVSDGRLTPTEDLAKIYRRISSRKNITKHLGYISTQGNDQLRNVLANYLNETRGLSITKEHILITRGSQMGIWLSAQLLLKEEDIIVVGETNYASADITFLHQKAKVLRVPVDENGIDTVALENICESQQIKGVYVTSHHHHPTTVTLSAERRICLLNLAKKYSFAIIEDDYDYDFNYNHAPILPLASHDVHNNVIYIGSVCKTVAPVFRVGYLIANKEFVNEASQIRGLVDRQGDALLELTFAEFIESGDLDRHIRKVHKVYEKRRDLFCDLLREELNEYFSFKKPKGGMAVWLTLNKKYTWLEVTRAARKYKLEIGNFSRYDMAKTNHNAIRMGFARFNVAELHELIKRMKLTMIDLANLEKFA
ncbi:MocR-like pyridoxine biosynthesis transcription factor PdxR [Tenacibaculum jejuense]|uniref:Transcriptional regulator, GntR family with aminotransferase domain n=1 Tax=Tenacibaculum jejuense TaxID=584609 RepID=A0A238U8Q9_9FLAO|nr:PLP-dependent aminotransferase family protein [Tenacibaculum jejuense]SNR15376.1 Transcriptional regulator, GntR family with aminotransferase domain [Tenacibaculum jejuense]